MTIIVLGKCKQCNKTYPLHERVEVKSSLPYAMCKECAIKRGIIK